MSDMYGSPVMAERPGTVTAIGVMTIVNGALNIFYALTITLLVVVGTIGIGLLCSPLTLAPMVLGIFEIIYGIKLVSNPPKAVKPSTAIAILEICCILVLNVISVVVGIMALVFYSQDDVKAYFASINRA